MAFCVDSVIEDAIAELERVQCPGAILCTPLLKVGAGPGVLLMLTCGCGRATWMCSSPLCPRMLCLRCGGFLWLFVVEQFCSSLV
ncbi:hypothetical protein Nepgr_032327 [Nepenthes gracilis]|uniref:Uncharacterized protein n=1 Tax=Nepenthes gracilis TaxID=150966 RepID=A0AAD3TJW3_NEPGR|nr:hypothetical protein Nepgr_032327 [Nepenthes gracilis]